MNHYYDAYDEEVDRTYWRLLREIKDMGHNVKDLSANHPINTYECQNCGSTIIIRPVSGEIVLYTKRLGKIKLIKCRDVAVKEII